MAAIAVASDNRPRITNPEANAASSPKTAATATTPPSPPTPMASSIGAKAARVTTTEIPTSASNDAKTAGDLRTESAASSTRGSWSTVPEPTLAATRAASAAVQTQAMTSTIPSAIIHGTALTRMSRPSSPTRSSSASVSSTVSLERNVRSKSRSSRISRPLPLLKTATTNTPISAVAATHTDAIIQPTRRGHRLERGEGRLEPGRERVRITVRSPVRSAVHADRSNCCRPTSATSTPARGRGTSPAAASVAARSARSRCDRIQLSRGLGGTRAAQVLPSDGLRVARVRAVA